MAQAPKKKMRSRRVPTARVELGKTVTGWRVMAAAQVLLYFSYFSTTNLRGCSALVPLMWGGPLLSSQTRVLLYMRCPNTAFILFLLLTRVFYYRHTYWCICLFLMLYAYYFFFYAFS